MISPLITPPQITFNLRDELATNNELSEKVSRAIAQNGCFYLSNQGMEKAALKIAAKILLQNLQDAIPKTKRATYCPYTHQTTIRILVKPLTTSEEEQEAFFQRSITIQNACLRTLPNCKYTKWFKESETEIQALIKATNRGHPVCIFEEIYPIPPR